jgi:hypothetical protein
MHTLGMDTNKVALPATRMSAPKTKTRVGISSSPPATPRKVLAVPMTRPRARPAVLGRHERG